MIYGQEQKKERVLLFDIVRVFCVLEVVAF